MENELTLYQKNKNKEIDVINELIDFVAITEEDFNKYLKKDPRSNEIINKIIDMYLKYNVCIYNENSYINAASDISNCNGISIIKKNDSKGIYIPYYHKICGPIKIHTMQNAINVSGHIYYPYTLRKFPITLTICEFRSANMTSNLLTTDFMYQKCSAHTLILFGCQHINTFVLRYKLHTNGTHLLLTIQDMITVKEHGYTMSLETITDMDELDNQLSQQPGGTFQHHLHYRHPNIIHYNEASEYVKNNLEYDKKNMVDTCHEDFIHFQFNTIPLEKY